MLIYCTLIEYPKITKSNKIITDMPYKQRVGGSNPSTPTSISRSYGNVAPFFMVFF